MTSAHPHVDAWLAMASEINQFVASPPMAGAQFRAPPTHASAGRMLVFQWGRGVRSFRAIETLVRAHFREDATVLARTLLEGLFEMAFIAKHPEAADIYVSHGARTQAANFKEMREKADLPPELRASVGMAEARSLIQYPEQTMNPVRAQRSRWHPKFPTVRSRAIEAGVNPLYYEALYSFTSRYVHGSGDWMSEFVSPPLGQDSRVSYEGSSAESALALMSACMCIVEEIRILDGCLSLELGGPLEMLTSHEKDLFARLGSAVLRSQSGAEMASDGTAQQSDEAAPGES